MFSWPTIALLVYSSVNVRNVQYTVKLWTLYSLPPGKFTIYSMTTLCHGHWCYMPACFYLFQILMGATAFMELWIHGVMNAASGYKEYIERLKYWLIDWHPWSPLPSPSICLKCLTSTGWLAMTDVNGGVQCNRLVDWWSNRIPTKIVRCKATYSRYRWIVINTCVS